MSDVVMNIPAGSQEQLVEQIRKSYPQAQGPEAMGAKDEFCTIWAQVKMGLEALKVILGFVPGVGLFAGAAISIVVAAGDAAQKALCNK